MTRRGILVTTATVLLLGSPVVAACSGDDTLVAGPSLTSDERAATSAAPDAVATPAALAAAAADPVTSGRIQMRSGVVDVDVRFDGDDLSMTTSEPAETEILLVDGDAYVKLGDRYTRLPFGGLLGEMEEAPWSTTLDATLDALRTAATEGEPVRTSVDGIDVDRYHVTLSGTEATELLPGVDGSTTDELGADRIGRILRYATDHTSVDITADVDDGGRLHRVELTADADTSAYPDCSLYRMTPTDMTVVITEIGRPQHIQAPAPDEVADLTELDPTELLDEIVGEGTSPAELEDRLGDVLDQMGPFDEQGSFDGLYEGCPE